MSAHEGKTAEDSPAVRLALRIKCGRATAGRLTDSTSQPESAHEASRPSLPARPSAAIFDLGNTAPNVVNTLEILQ